MNELHTYVIMAQRPVTKRQNPVNHTILMVGSFYSEEQARNAAMVQFGDRITGIRSISMVPTGVVEAVRG